MAENNDRSTMSRRRFIKNSSYAAGGVIGGGFLGTLIGRNLAGDENTEEKAKKDTSSAPKQDFNRALMHFTSMREFNILSEATERIFPEDDNGPGAIKLGVPFFIDHQLAGAYGHNDREYMLGPFYPGSDFQGYQTRLKRHEVFDAGIEAIQRESKREFDTPFVDLKADQQDQILRRFQKGEVKMKGVTSTTFFELLRSATIEGAYSDPLYGGNGNMEGWMMKEFPGSYMSYINEIGKEEFIDKEPRPLRAHIQ